MRDLAPACLLDTLNGVSAFGMQLFFYTYDRNISSPPYGDRYYWSVEPLGLQHFGRRGSPTVLRSHCRDQEPALRRVDSEIQRSRSKMSNRFRLTFPVVGCLSWAIALTVMT
jgi:hypothetical protein